ncbi:hypothetical protein BOX15_Mlig022944g1, partial [Macrostomum lignano]
PRGIHPMPQGQPPPTSHGSSQQSQQQQPPASQQQQQQPQQQPPPPPQQQQQHNPYAGPPSGLYPPSPYPPYPRGAYPQHPGYPGGPPGYPPPPMQNPYPARSPYHRPPMQMPAHMQHQQPMPMGPPQSQQQLPPPHLPPPPPPPAPPPSHGSQAASAATATATGSSMAAPASSALASNTSKSATSTASANAPSTGGPPTLEPQTNLTNGSGGGGGSSNNSSSSGVCASVGSASATTSAAGVVAGAYIASPISSAKDGDSSTIPPGSPASTSFQDDENSMISSPSTPALPPNFNSNATGHGGGAGGVSSSSTSLHKLFELGSEPERRQWVERYLQFMEERGKPLTNLPQVAKQPLDLYRLYCGVRERGGVLEVVKSKKWKEVSQFIHINASASAAYTLRRNYTKYLIDFEYHFDRDGCDPRPVVDEIEAMTKKKTGPAGGPANNAGGKAAMIKGPDVASMKSEDSSNHSGGRGTPATPNPAMVNGGAPGQMPPHGMHPSMPPHHQHQPGMPNGMVGGPPPEHMYPHHMHHQHPPPPPHHHHSMSNGGPVPPYPHHPHQPPPPHYHPAYQHPHGYPPANGPGYTMHHMPPWQQRPPLPPPPSSSSAAPGSMGAPMPPHQHQHHPPPPPMSSHSQQQPPSSSAPSDSNNHLSTAPSSSAATTSASSATRPMDGQQPYSSGGCNSSHQLTKLEHMVSSHQPPPQSQTSSVGRILGRGNQPPQQQQQQQRPPPPMPHHHPMGPPSQHPPSHQYAGQMGPPMTQQQQHPPHHQPYSPYHHQQPHPSHHHQHHLSVPPQHHHHHPGQHPQHHPHLVQHRQLPPLDPKTVEGIEPRVKHKALNQKDIGGPVDIWRVLMALRSGLLTEVTWALNVLNVLLADSGTCDMFGLTRLAGLFDALVDVWRRLLIDLHAGRAATDENRNLLSLETDQLRRPADRASGICLSSRHVKSCLRWPRKRRHSDSSDAGTNDRDQPTKPAAEAPVAPAASDNRHATVFVNETEEDRNQLKLRCRAVLNVIRSLSFLPSNESVIGNHSGFLRIAATLLNTPGDSLMYDVDDLLVILSNVAGHVALERLSECVCRPLVSVLLRRLHEDAWFGLACETLAKLCVRPENIDLVLATPDRGQLRDTLEMLCGKLRQRDQVQRELSLALLVYLLAHSDDWSVCELAAQCSPGPVRPILDFLEQVESQAVHICQQYGVQALAENPDLLRQAPGVVSLDLLQRAVLSLRCVMERGGEPALASFAREEDRLLMLCMSSVLQPSLTEPLAECLRRLSCPEAQLVGPPA